MTHYDTDDYDHAPKDIFGATHCECCKFKYKYCESIDQYFDESDEPSNPWSDENPIEYAYLNYVAKVRKVLRPGCGWCAPKYNQYKKKLLEEAYRWWIQHG